MSVTVRKRAQVEYVIADCLTTDSVGDMVRVSADAVGGVYQVTKIDIEAGAVELPVGMLVQKVTTTRGAVQVGGEVLGVYTGLIPGKQLFIGNDARLTHAVPTPPTIGVRLVHPAAHALSSSTLLLRIQNPTIRVS